MKIDNINNYVNYHKNVSTIKRKTNCLSDKCDRIKINKLNRNYAKNIEAKDISDIKNKIVLELNDENELKKVESLKIKIENNSYNVDSNELAQILLNI